MEKQWYKSKRLWTGALTLVTGISLIFTGEKTLQEMLPELVMTTLGLVQLVVAMASGDPIAFGSKTFYKE